MRLPGELNMMRSQGLAMEDEMNLDGAITAAAFDDTLDMVSLRHVWPNSYVDSASSSIISIKHLSPPIAPLIDTDQQKGSNLQEQFLFPILTSVPEQLNMEVVTGACMLIDDCIFYFKFCLAKLMLKKFCLIFFLTQFLCQAICTQGTPKEPK